MMVVTDKVAKGQAWMIGHNGGPSLAPGATWRRMCWQKAREALLPVLPIEVLRTRVRRASDLGLDYRTYASVRAQTGHDVVTFLFSSNAVQVTPFQLRMPGDIASKLACVQAERIGLLIGAIPAIALADLNPELDRVEPAPQLWAGFGAARHRLREILGAVPGDKVVLVGDQPLEAEWCAAGRLAAYLTAERYFGRGPADLG